MKRKFLLLMLALIAMATTARAQVVLNETNFPDANFRKALASRLRINEGEEITAAKIAATKSLNISGKSIEDLTGIKHFTALTYLKCDNNQLTELDVSKNTALERLDCYGNQLTLLDVSKNTALDYLHCAYNQLTELDVSKNTALITLYCHINQLASLDVSKNTVLTELACSYNQLTSLDVSKNTALERLACYNNQLTSLDISKNTELTLLNCGDNLLTTLNVSQNTALTTLYCYCNKIKGKAMDELIASLPNVSKGEFSVICTQDENEGNVCTKVQVKVAKEKGWRISDYSKEPRNWTNANDPDPEYEGSDEEILLDEENFGDANFREVLSGILNIAEGDDITEEIINNTTTLDVSNKSIADLSGIEYFTALTTIYCHVNQIKNEEMATLIAALSDLSSNEAKGMMRTEETNPRTGALYVLDLTDENEQNVCTVEHVAAANEKGWTVYCKTANGWQEYDGENPTGISAPLNDNGKMINDNWYSMDGVKLQGEPTRKGVYIVKSKKVVK